MCSKSKRELRPPRGDSAPGPAPPDAPVDPAPDNITEDPPKQGLVSAQGMELCMFPVEPEHLELNIEVTRIDIVVRVDAGDEELARGGSTC